MKRALVCVVPSALALTTVAPPAAAQAPLYDFSSPALAERVGASVVGIGDVDGDGYGDLAIGATRASGLWHETGAVRIHSGKTGALLRELKGEHLGDRFGHSLDALGDVDGDGAGDVIVGAPYHVASSGADRGAIYVFSGATGAQLAKKNGGSDGDRFGWAVTGVPDVDGDGVGDYAASEPWGETLGKTDNGIVWLYSGATHGFLRTFNGGADGDHFGYSIDGARDFDGDGRGDLLIGAPQADAAGIFDSGRGYRYSGATGALLSSVSGATTAGWLGHTVAALPDVTNDGRPEALLGEPFVSIGGVVGSGRIRAFSSQTGAVVLTLTGSTQENYGWVLAALEDFDGDGRGDVLVGAPNADVPPFTKAGVARVHSGASGAVVALMTGYHSNEGFGAAVGDAGDINGDGFHDALAGSPSFDLHVTDGGRARAILGHAPAPTNYCTGKVNSLGCTPLIGYGGCASVSVGDNLRIVGANLAPSVNGILIWSLSQHAAPFHGGTLCVGAPIRRTPVQTSVVDPASSYACQGSFAYEFKQAQMAAEGLVPGMELFAQYWHRDAGFPPPQNVGLTDGLRVPILP